MLRCPFSVYWTKTTLKKGGEKKRERNFQSVSRFFAETEASVSSRGCLDAPIINRADLNRGRVKGSLWKIKIWVCHAWRMRALWRNILLGQLVRREICLLPLYFNRPCDFHSLINVYAESFDRTTGLGLAKPKIHCLQNSCKSMCHFLVELYFRSVCSYSTPLTNTPHLGDL